MGVVPDDGLQGLTASPQRSGLGRMPNEQHQTTYGFMTGAPYELAIVEFDDQGRCYDRKQMDGIAARLDAVRADEKDVILFVFAHGWKNNALSDNGNLSSFREVLTQTVAFEKSSTSDGQTPRPVLGIYVGWRGLSEYGNDLIENATFWDRQSAGLRVAWGSVRELFGRLRHYRNHRLNRDGSPLVVISGRSFGGMIVYSALAQSLIEAASAPEVDVVPSLADLVLLVNPAFEGERYLPIFDLVSAPGFKARTATQLPVFVCAQADNDQPVGTWFPIGATPGSLLEATIGDLEKRCVTSGLGFVDDFRTHRLAGPSGSDPFVLDPPGSVQTNPFWVVRATPEVINNHGGIWQAPFMAFLASIIFQHVDGSKSAAGSRVKSSHSAAADDPSRGSLVEFAKSAGTNAPG